jgi:L-arabinose isomerase
MADGVGFAGEGDMAGAVGTWLVNRLSGPATFSEIFTIDFAGNAVLLSHMGESNVAMARSDRPVRVEVRERPIARIRGRQLALVPELPAGAGTLVALVQGPGGRWRFVYSPVRMLDWRPRSGMAVPHWKIAPTTRDVRDWLTAYAKAGGPHHGALCLGDAGPRLRALARIIDADTVEV